MVPGLFPCMRNVCRIWLKLKGSNIVDTVDFSCLSSVFCQGVWTKEPFVKIILGWPSTYSIYRTIDRHIDRHTDRHTDIHIDRHTDIRKKTERITTYDYASQKNRKKQTQTQTYKDIRLAFEDTLV